MFRRRVVRSAPWVGGRPQPGRGKQIALDIARGLAFMHAHCIVHLVRILKRRR